MCVLVQDLQKSQTKHVEVGKDLLQKITAFEANNLKGLQMCLYYFTFVCVCALVLF